VITNSKDSLHISLRYTEYTIVECTVNTLIYIVSRYIPTENTSQSYSTLEPSKWKLFLINYYNNNSRDRVSSIPQRTYTLVCFHPY